MKAFSMPLASHGVAIRNPALENRQLSVDIEIVPSIDIANRAPLRIMPLGASITFGVQSSDGNGYREYLRNALNRNPVNMVGNRSNGTMKDNENEGWPGLRIGEVHAKATSSVGTWKPNLVLINLGTNDASQDFQVSTAGERMKDLLEFIYEESPRATIILSTLLPNGVQKTVENVALINDMYRSLVTQLRSERKRIVLAEMQSADGPKLPDDFADETHPNDEGYKKMAIIWHRAIVEADKAGFIQRPEKVADLPDMGPKY